MQPSELAKMACVLFSALDPRAADAPHRRVRYSLAPIALIVGAMAGLILLQPDLGTAVSLLLIVGVMVFAAGLPYRLSVGWLLAAAIPVALHPAARADYRRKRLMAFLDPWADPLGDGFQLIQSTIAVGAGGVFGRGLMAGVQKLFYLPEPHTDFIYAVIGEELGLVGRAGDSGVLRRHRVARAAGCAAGRRTRSARSSRSA